MTENRAHSPPATLEDLIAKTIDLPVPAPVRLLAEEARKRHQKGRGVAAVLAYGSTLREASPEESLVDLYVLTFDSAAISDNPLSRLGCRLLPPNVYYLEVKEETEQGPRTWRAKYACLTLDQFTARMQDKVRNPYFWARFSQPSRLVWAQDEAVREQVISALATAVRTMLTFARRLASDAASCPDLWQKALIATYASELRVEGPERARLIVSRNHAFMTAACALIEQEAHTLRHAQRHTGESRYLKPQTHEPAARALGLRRGDEKDDTLVSNNMQDAANNPPPAPLSKAALRFMQIEGKVLSVLRLIKAAFTFAGGADYIAWKIARHTGEKIELTPFERRHPLFAAIRHLPRLLRRGAVK